MAISISSSYYGRVLYQLITDKKNFKITTFPTQSANSYSINDNQIGLHIKYLRRNSSPWNFTFTKQQQEELRIMYEMHDHCFLVFVCGDDGITCIHYDELKIVLDEFYEEQEWVKLSRLSGQSYSVSGKDGKLNHKLRNSDFPSKVIELIE